MILNSSVWRPEGEPVPVPERKIVRTGPDRAPTLPAAAPAKGSWPSFRGPNASGVADGQNLPDTWNGASRTNILWKTAIPGLAHSSPVVWGDRIYVTSAVSSRGNATFKPGLYGPLLSMGRQKFGNLLVKPNQADLIVLKELCETGKVRPVIDRRFPLSEVAAAVRYVEDGHARGKVAITV
jgi:hypothetical protein